MQVNITTSDADKRRKIKWLYMIYIIIVLLLSLIFLSLINPLSAATTYYWISGPLNNLSSWKTNPNGSGTSPTNFTTGTNTFIIWNSISTPVSPTLTGVWNFGGGNILQIGTSTGSATLSISNGTLNLGGNVILNVGNSTNTVSQKLYIDVTGVLNITSGAATPLRVHNNATLTIASTTFPASAAVQLNANSTVEWAQNSNITIWGRTYQNMIISGTGIKTCPTGANVTVNGILQMQSGALQMANSIFRTLTLNGTITGTAPIRTANTNLTINGSGNFGTLYFANGVTPLQIRNFTINRAGSGQITLGSNLTVGNTFNFSRGVLNLNNQTLTLNGAITFPTSPTNGYFIGSRNSSLIIGGAGAITNALQMSTANINTSSLFNFTMNRNNRSIAISSPLNIWGELSALTGTIVSNGNIRIKADALQKGRVAPIGTNADITGNVTVEVYAKGNTTGWAQLSACGVSGQSVSAWTDDFPVSCPSGCPYTSSFISIYSYSEAAVANCYSCAAHYVPITNSLSPLNTGRGYYVYLGTSPYTTTDIIIDMTGPLVKKNYGSISLTRTGPSDVQNGWNLIGNPYASPISFTNILNSLGSNSVNIENTIYVWNTDLNGGAGDHAIYKPGIGSVPPVANGGIDDNIPTGQGVFVRAINPISLFPNENWKSNTNSQNNLLRLSHPASSYPASYNTYPPSLFILEMKGPNNYDVYTGIAIHPNATTSFDYNYDATQLGSDPPAPQLMSILNGYEYKINTIPPVSGTMSIDIKAITGVSGNYTIYPININQLSTGACIYLYDKYTNTMTDLRTNYYAFYLSDTTTTARFTLMINNNSINANTTMLQASSCMKSADGKAMIQILTPGIFNCIWKDNQGYIIATHNNISSSDTLSNLLPGVYFCEVASLSGCSSSVYSVTITSSYIAVPTASFTLTTNDTLPLNYSSPFIAYPAASNADTIYWEVIGDGYTTSQTIFSYMPSATGDYIIRLYAINLCGDTAIYDMPIVVLTGPDDTTYVPSPAHTYELIIQKDESGYFVQSKIPTSANIYLSDMTGRIIFFQSRVWINEQKKYLPLPNLSTGLWLLTVETSFTTKTYKIIE